MTIKYDHLVGKPFTGIGRDDCFSLFRQLYADNFNININNYARPHDWSSDKIDIIRLTYEREGFEMITKWKLKDLRPGDLMCMAIGEQNANHIAIYVGEGKLIQHLYGRFSSVDNFRDFYRNSTCYLLRHPDVPDLRPVYPDVDIASLVRARNLPATE